VAIAAPVVNRLPGSLVERPLADKHGLSRGICTFRRSASLIAGVMCATRDNEYQGQ
jgi:hypothetical protein